VQTFGASHEELQDNDLLRPWLTHHGHLTQPQLGVLLGSCDVFVDFSEYQAMGLTLLEAMASGCAVIGPVAGGANSFLRDETNGVLVDTSLVEECIEKTNTIVRDAGLRGRLQQRAIDDASLHPPEAAALNMLQVLFH